MSSGSDPAGADIEFFWDPVCPFAWITSRWVEQVSRATGYSVRWRFISLRLLNKDKDYATEFPPEYEQGHTAGLRMLRVCAAIRAELGDAPLGAIVAAYGHSVWDRPPQDDAMSMLSTPEHARAVLREAGVPERFADVARRHVLGRRARRRDRAGPRAHRARRGDTDHHLPSPRRTVVLRSGDLTGPPRRRRRAALGRRHDARWHSTASPSSNAACARCRTSSCSARPTTRLRRSSRTGAGVTGSDTSRATGRPRARVVRRHLSSNRAWFPRPPG